MTPEQLKSIYQLVKYVGNFQIEEQKKLASIEIEEKSLNQLVSYVDIESEKLLVSGLQDITPNCGFITEEETNTEVKDNNWVIDPIDGTTNYLFGHHLYSISIAYQERGKTVYGAVYIPPLDEYYWSNEDGAFLNDQSISISDRKSLSESLLATGFPYYEFKELEEYIAVLKVFMQETKGLRRMGSAAIDLIYTACGKFDCFFELNLNPWDIAAGAFIVQQAGGVVTDFKGQDGFGDGKQIVAGNSPVAKDVLSVLNEAGLR